MPKRKHVVSKSVRRTQWKELSPIEQEQVGAQLVASVLYPAVDPTKEVKPGQRKELERRKKNIRRNRRRVVRVELTNSLLPRLETIAADFGQKNSPGRRERIVEFLNLLIGMWGRGLINTVKGASRFSFYEKRPKTQWADIANAYLVALLFLRQRADRRQHPDTKQTSLNRALWLGTHAYPEKWVNAHGKSLLTRSVERKRTAWPILCGLMFSLSDKRRLEDNENSWAEHVRLLTDAPTTSEWIQCVLQDPQRVFSVASYFEDQLTGASKDSLPRLVKLERCEVMPSYRDLPRVFTPPGWLLSLAEHERVIASEYSFKKLKHGRGRKKK